MALEWPRVGVNQFSLRGGGEPRSLARRVQPPRPLRKPAPVRASHGAPGRAGRLARPARGGPVGRYREAIASLRGGRRGERLHRVLERTYLRPGLTQAQAAVALGLPFSTYRRHLKEAVDALEDFLWQEDRHAGR